MKRLVAIALIAACSTEEAGVGFPIQPGGGVSVGGMSGVDAAVDAGDAGDASTTIIGRVCLLVQDLRGLANCASAGADNLTVTLGTSVAITGANGAFTIMRPADTTGLSWSVTGGIIVRSLVPFGSTTTLPAFGAVAYEQMVADNDALTSPTTGGMVVRVTMTGTSTPVTGATVQTTPAPDSLVYYDGATDSTWDTVNGTGGNGVAWIPSIPGDSAQVTITADNMQHMLANVVPLAANAITFVFAEIP